MNHTAKLDEVLELVDEAWYGEPIAGTWPAFWSGREYHDGDPANGRVRIYTDDNEVVLLTTDTVGVEACKARFSEAFPAAIIASALEALLVALVSV